MDQTNLILSCKIPYGKRAIIRKIESKDPNYATRLREIGFTEGITISKFSDDGHNSCIILSLDGKKVLVNEDAAHSIFVELIN